MSGRIENILPLLACVIPLGCPDCSATASAPMERKGGLSFPPFPLVCYCCCCCLYCARGERDVRKKKTHTQSARFDARSRVPSAMKKNDNFNSFSSSSFYRGQFSLFTPTALLLLSSLCCLRGEIGFLFLPASGVPCVVQVPSVSCLIFFGVCRFVRLRFGLQPYIFATCAQTRTRHSCSILIFLYNQFLKEKKAI